MKKRWFLPGLVLLVAGLVWYSYYNLTFTHLFLNDAMDYASMGRNVSRGDGFISSYITPLSLANREGLPHPDLWRAPLWPLVLALFIKMLGASDQAVAIATGAFFIGGALLVFLLGREMFSRLTGFLAALIFIGSAQNLMNSVSGMTETLAVFLMLLTVYLAVAGWARGQWGDILTGAALGLFYLARYNAMLFVPFTAWFIWYRRRQDTAKGGLGLYTSGRRGNIVQALWPAVRVLAAFVLVISPWLVRNYLLMGSPLFSLQKYEPVMFTSVYPGYTLYMMFTKVNALEFMLANPWEIWAKVAAGWAEFWRGLFDPVSTGVSPYLFGLFLLSILIPAGWLHLGEERTTGPRGVRLLVARCFLAQLAALLVVHFIYRLFFIFMPFYIIFGLAGAHWLITVLTQRLPVKRDILPALGLTALVAWFILTNLPSWSPLKPGNTPIVGLKDQVKAVTNMSTRNELIASNDGHLLAWYGDRYAVKLPYSVDMLPRMEEAAPLKFIYLSPRMSWNIPEADRSWSKVYWSKPQEVYGFKLVRVFPDGGVIYRKR